MVMARFPSPYPQYRTTDQPCARNLPFPVHAAAGTQHKKEPLPQLADLLSGKATLPVPHELWWVEEEEVRR
jgi:hypothetical protein